MDIVYELQADLECGLRKRGIPFSQFGEFIGMSEPTARRLRKNPLEMSGELMIVLDKKLNTHMREILNNY